MSVKDLIKTAKACQPGKAELPDAAMADLKAVLRANAAEPNRFKRVSASRFLAYLKAEYGVEISGATLRRITSDMGLGWTGVERG